MNECPIFKPYSEKLKLYYTKKELLLGENQVLF